MTNQSLETPHHRDDKPVATDTAEMTTQSLETLQSNAVNRITGAG